MQLINQIKMTYEKPVITLCGWDHNESVIARTKLISNFFLLPYKFEAIMEAFKKCLDKLPGFD
ncbi:MAG: hypothetical protein DRH93_21160 [Deltaproteobacteria bacterium]|nr:MAG: hypothetical protein DRH93_21160 [Deltaproteobacteria bacterium]